nr:sigma factor-like helix-turn-helix DNA-binding protein [Nocardia transvalensis]
MLDDLGESVSFGLEQADETLAAMVAEQAEERPRDGELITQRLGLDGERPETLTLIGARYGLSRDRVRQLYTRAAGQMVRRVRATGHPDTAIFAERYPVGWQDERLVRTLLAEIYATDSDIAAQDLAYLRLRLAGHALMDAKRMAGFVFQRIAGWQQRGRWHLNGPRHAEPVAGQLVPLLRRADWPGGKPADLPDTPAPTVDADDDARGSIFAEKLGRETTFDTALEALLLRILDTSEQVAAYVERPGAVDYRLDDAERTHYPTVAARLTDGRALLIDVVPPSRLAVHGNRVKLDAARAWAHERGWGRLVFTGSRLGEPDLRDHRVDARHENILRNRLAEGPLGWPEFRRYVDETGIGTTDFTALVLRHGWRWDRGPFRLARAG